MALFRFHEETTAPYYIELGWQGASYRNNQITVNLTEKKDEDDFHIVEEIGSFKHDPEQAKLGYKFKSSKIGEIEIKFVTKFLIISEIQVTVSGKKVKGSEILNYIGIGQVGKHT